VSNLGMLGRLTRIGDTDLLTGQALVRSATGWAIQAVSGGRVDAIATHDSLAGEGQAAKLIGTGGVIEALGGEALVIGERVMVTVTTGRLISWVLGGESVGIVDSACAADGDLFNLIPGGSAPTTA
jgi:hypothetical protein